MPHLSSVRGSIPARRANRRGNRPNKGNLRAKEEMREARTHTHARTEHLYCRQLNLELPGPPSDGKVTHAEKSWPIMQHCSDFAASPWHINGK